MEVNAAYPIYQLIDAIEKKQSAVSEVRLTDSGKYDHIGHPTRNGRRR